LPLLSFLFLFFLKQYHEPHPHFCKDSLVSIILFLTGTML
jgi:hypothetical protein